MPIGMIIDANPLPKAVDIWALVLNNIVVNTIVASTNDIQAIYKTYDYSVDVTMQGQAECGTGFTYNASLNQFIPPPSPPIDWVANVQADFDNVISSLQQVMIDIGPSGGSLSPAQINTAYNSSLNDNPGLDIPTRNLMTTILQYVLSGG